MSTHYCSVKTLIGFQLKNSYIYDILLIEDIEDKSLFEKHNYYVFYMIKDQSPLAITFTKYIPCFHFESFIENNLVKTIQVWSYQNLCLYITEIHYTSNTFFCISLPTRYNGLELHQKMPGGFLRSILREAL